MQISNFKRGAALSLSSIDFNMQTITGKTDNAARKQVLIAKVVFGM